MRKERKNIKEQNRKRKKEVEELKEERRSLERGKGGNTGRKRTESV